jgi:small-conductance mechanosensitive channel
VYRLLVFFFILFASNAFAENKNVVIKNSLKKDTLQVEESILIRQQQQAKLDSLLKIQLEDELKKVGGDLAKTAELQERLKSIEQADSVRRLQQLKKIKDLKQSVIGYPVTLLNDTLYYVYLRLGSFKAKDRAESISKKITNLYENTFFNPDSLQVELSEDSHDIIYNNDVVVMAITDLDAFWHNKSPDVLANEYLLAIKQKIKFQKSEHSLINWAKRIGLVLAVILGLTILIRLVNRLFKKGEAFFERKNQQLFEFLESRKIKIFSPEQIKGILLKVYNVLRVLVILVVLYLSLPILFSIFPETENLTSQLIQWILTPVLKTLNSLIAFLPDLFTIIIIYLFFKYTIKGLKYFVKEISRGDIKINGFHADWASPTFNILKFILYAFMFVIIWPYLPGSGSAAFQGVSVFLGILISLGSSSAITNMVAGLVITYMRPFKIGDRVKIGDHVGDVVEKTMLVTRIKTIKNEDITVPNSAVLSGSTINYSSNTKNMSEGLIVHTTITIGYDVPWKKLHEVLIAAALKVDLIKNDPKPFVLQTSLDDFYVSYQINAYTKFASKQASIYSQLHQNIQDACNQAGIEILSPHYRASRDGNMITIPSEYLPDEYKVPISKVSKDL